MLSARPQGICGEHALAKKSNSIPDRGSRAGTEQRSGKCVKADVCGRSFTTECNFFLALLPISDHSGQPLDSQL